MRGRITPIILVLTISLLVQLPDTSANPVPFTDMQQLNMVVLSNNSVIKFVSEIVNITVDKELGMDVQAMYTLTNPTNETVVQDILLPYVRFSVARIAGIGVNTMYYLRFNHSFVNHDRIDVDDEEILENFGLKDRLQLGGYMFNLTFDPMQTGVLEVRYKSELGYTTLVKDEPKKNQYRMVYITSSTAFWREPLESATIDIWIDRDIITDHPSGGGEFELLPDLAHVKFHYQDWIPAENIDLVWNCTEGNEFGTDTYGDLKSVFFKCDIPRDGPLSFYNITIIDDGGNPIRFLNNGRIMRSKYQSTNVSDMDYYVTLYLMETYTPSCALTLYIRSPDYENISIPLDRNLSRYNLGNLYFQPIPVKEETTETNIYLTGQMIAIYIFGAIFLIIALAISFLTFREKRREKTDNDGSK